MQTQTGLVEDTGSTHFNVCNCLWFLAMAGYFMIQVQLEVRTSCIVMRLRFKFYYEKSLCKCAHTHT